MLIVTPFPQELVAAEPALPSFVQLIQATTPEDNDHFGLRTALDGNRAAVSSSAGVEVFHRGSEDLPWVSGGALSPGDVALGDRFGDGISLDGQVLAVTAASQGAGAVYLFEADESAEDGTGWTLATKLTPEPDSGLSYGSRVEVAGDSVAVYAFTGSGGNRVGRVLLFGRQAPGDGGGWVLETELVPAQSEPGDDFGQTLGFDGSVLAAYSRRAEAVFVFEQGAAPDCIGWAETATLANVLPGLPSYGSSGIAVDSGVVAVSGAQDILLDGRTVEIDGVLFFERLPGGTSRWELTGSVFPTGPRGDYPSGIAIKSGAFDAGRLLVSNDSFDLTGLAFILGRRTQEDGGGWGQLATVAPSALDPEPRFGFSGDISGPDLLVGDILDNDAAAPGRAYAFRLGPSPVLDTRPELFLSPVLAGGDVNPGTPVSSLLAQTGFPLVQSVPGAAPGIAVTGLEVASGSWSFQLVGVPWEDLAPVSPGAAVLLGPADRVRFTPADGVAGTVDAALTFVAWDGRSGVAGERADTTGNEGASAFSALSKDVSIHVLTENAPPAVVGGTVLAAPLGESVTVGWEVLAFADPEGEIPPEVRFVLGGEPLLGEVSLDGEVLGAGGSFSQADVDAGRLVYRATVEHPGIERVDLTVSDSLGAAAGGVLEAQLFGRNRLRQRFDPIVHRVNASQLGSAVAVSGTRFVAGDPVRDHALVYDYDPVLERWLEPAMLEAPRQWDGDNFGAAVDLDGDFAIVAATVSEPGPVAGVYRWTPEGWVEDAVIESDVDQIIFDIALDGDTALVSGRFTGEGETMAKAYTRSDGTWEEAGTLAVAGETVSNFEFPKVAIDGDFAVVGVAPLRADLGDPHAYLFERQTPGGWTLVRALDPGPINAETIFGFSVDIDGDRAVVGGTRTPGGEGDGAFVFERDFGGPGAWGLAARIDPPRWVSPVSFAFTVSLAGDRLVVGHGEDFGSFVFDRGESGWGLSVVVDGRPGPGLDATTGLLVSGGGSIDAWVEVHLIPGFGVPEVVLPPGSLERFSGEEARFSATVTGGVPLDFQWKKDGLETPGASGPKLVLPALSTADAGDYTLVLISAHGGTVSPVATLEVTDAAPTITVQPELVLEEGEPAQLAVQLAGSLPWTITWMKDGAVIDGETGGALEFPVLELEDEGRYQVRVENAFGTVESDPFDLLFNQVQRLAPEGAREYVAFGDALAVDDTTLAVTEPFDERVHLYRRDGFGWVAAQVLESPSAGARSFANAVALSGGVLVVGDWEDSTHENRGGAAFVYEPDPADPGQWILAADLFPPDPEDRARFGIDVATDGEVVAVAKKPRSGPSAVYLFTPEPDGGWGLLQTIDPPDGSRDFGDALAFSGDFFVVRSDEDAWFYRRDPAGSVRELGGALEPGGGWTLSPLGRTVAVGEGIVALGVRMLPEEGGRALALGVAIFRPGGGDPPGWEVAEVIPLDGIDDSHRWGIRDIAIEGGRLAVGANFVDVHPLFEPGFSPAGGRVEVFDLTADPVRKDRVYTLPEAEANNRFGSAVGFGGGFLCIGASGSFRPTAPFIPDDLQPFGAVFAYRLPEEPPLPPRLRFEEWVLEQFPGQECDLDVAGAGIDHSGDGVNNLLAFALALDPRGQNFSDLPRSEVVRDGGARMLRLRFQRSLQASGVDLIPEASSDLVNWTPVVEPVFKEGEEGDAERLWVDVPVPAGAPVYLRLRARLTPP